MFEVANCLCVPIKRSAVIADFDEYALGSFLCHVKGRLQVEKFGPHVINMHLQLLQHPRVYIELHGVSSHAANNAVGDRRLNVITRNRRRAEGAFGEEIPREPGGWEQFPYGIQFLKTLQ